jgi:hypothetical protein
MERIVKMRDSGFVIRAILGVAAAFALQSVQAGERKPAAVQAHHLGASIHRAALVAPARSGRQGDLSGSRLRSENGRELAGMRSGASQNTTRGEFSFVPVTPLGPGADDRSRLRQGDGAPKEKGPATPPAERKNITLFRLDPKLGDVSVQPVVGGVNGAQLLVGF